MKTITYLLLLLSSLCSPALAGDLTIEVASGVASPHAPFSSHWGGAVGDNSLFHKEFSFRAGYVLKDWLSVSTTLGWLRNRATSSRNYIYPTEQNLVPPYDYHAHERMEDVTYFIPSLKFSHNIIRVDLGTIIYSAHQTGIGYRTFDYPFNGSHLFKPVLGIELGEQEAYLFARFLDSFPLYTSGLTSVGIGGRLGGKYEQQIFLLGGPLEMTAFGYRGEFKVYRQTAALLGISMGFGINDNDNVYLISLGLKTALSL
jgi:hypothetical protein